MFDWMYNKDEKKELCIEADLDILGGESNTPKVWGSTFLLLTTSLIFTK